MIGLGESQRPQATPRVVVAGAGLAGLAAAHELTREGYRVTVLEAARRAGGRVHTLRQPFDEGLYAEAGALAFSDRHELVVTYCRQLGLTLAPIPAYDLAPRHFSNGRFLDGSTDLRTSDLIELTSAEIEAGVEGIPALHLQPLVEAIGDPLEGSWPSPELLPWDDVSLADLLSSRGASSDAVKLVERTYRWNRGFRHGSALHQLAEWRHSYMSSRQWYAISGGNDRLPAALAEQLAPIIRFGIQVRAIEQLTDLVRVHCHDRGSIITWEADHVVCALPLAVARDIEFIPALSPAKREAMDALEIESVLRGYVQCRTRVWVKGKPNGWVFTDLPIMNVGDAAAEHRGSRGVLGVYISGPQAERAGGAEILEQLEVMYPGIGGQAEKVVTYCWRENPFACGAYAWAPRAAVRRSWPYLAAPEGRVHFAGAHTSRWFEWQQGALDSGRRAALEIQAASCRSEPVTGRQGRT